MANFNVKDKENFPLIIKTKRELGHYESHENKKAIVLIKNIF